MGLGPSARALSTCAIAVLTASCQAFVDSDTAGGIGAPCNKDSDCQGAKCEDDVCTLECTSPDVCPEGTFCAADARCHLPLRAAFIYPGDPEIEQWSRAHDLGRIDAATLPYVVEARVWAGAQDPEQAAAAIDEAVAEGMHVVFVASPTNAQRVAEKAQQYPDTRFYTTGSSAESGNSGGYYGRIYEAWYLAGKAAAAKSTSGRLGMIGSYVTPIVLQNVNAFTLGARSTNPDAVVRLEWLGFWHDPSGNGIDSGERTRAEALLADGCDVIAHLADNGYAVEAVQDQGMGLAIGHNVADACKDRSRCFATVFWSWGPLYRQILRDYHRGEAAPAYYAEMLPDTSASVPRFLTSDSELAASLEDDIANLVADGGVGPTFAGPFCTTETPARCFDEANPVTEEVLETMCFLVEGVVEKDAMDMDVPAQVPASGDCVPAPEM